MSLSRLEKDAVLAEEQRVAKLREKARADTADERKLRKKILEDEREHTRYCVKALEDNIWYYKDRAGLPRGPCQLTNMRACWVNGVIDETTLVWGQGLEAWYPIRNVVGLVTNIQSLDVLIFKWLHDKFILQPRLERIRAQRKEALKALKQGKATLTPEQVAQIKEEGGALKLGAPAEPHPALRVWAMEQAERAAAAAVAAAGYSLQKPAAGAAAPPAGRAPLASLSLALPLPLPKGWQPRR